jgi:hypothetical protein
MARDEQLEADLQRAEQFGEFLTTQLARHTSRSQATREAIVEALDRPATDTDPAGDLEQFMAGLFGRKAVEAHRLVGAEIREDQ